MPLSMSSLEMVYVFYYRIPKSVIVGSLEVNNAVVPREKLEETRRQVASGLRKTRDFIRYHLERLRDRFPTERVSRLLAEAEDRFR